MHVKIFTMVKDEEDIIEYWINYHGSIFGYRNLYIIDNMSTDGTYEKIMKYKPLGIQVFRETDYKEKGVYMTKLIKNKQIGHYDIAFPMDIDEFVVHYDKTNNNINPEFTKKYVDEVLVNDFNKYEVFKCNYIETILTTNNNNGYNNALLETEYGRYNDYKNMAKTFFNRRKWNGVLDHGNHYYSEQYKLTDLCLVHYHCRNMEQMKKKIINNVKGLDYEVDLEYLKNVIKENPNAHGSHHINNMIKILENDYTLTLFNDCNHVDDIRLGPLIHYFSKLP